MIKELIVTIALGSLLGFGITGGYFAIKKNSASNNNNLPTPTPIISQSPTISITQTNDTSQLSTQNHTLSIESPENNALFSVARITVKGQTSPKSHIIVTTSQKIFTTTSDSVGNFEIDIDLESGANLVKLESISTTDEQAKTEITVTYSTAKI